MTSLFGEDRMDENEFRAIAAQLTRDALRDAELIGWNKALTDVSRIVRGMTMKETTRYWLLHKLQEMRGRIEKC